MQLFLRNLNARTKIVEATQNTHIMALKCHIEEIEGIPTDSQVLLFGSKILHDSQTLKQAGLRDHSTISIVSRLRGGKPVKVKMMTQHLPCGPEVTIDIEKDATKDEIKHKLAEVTGVPVEHQKVLLSGINQIMMGDKRTNIGYSACGFTNGVQMAVGK